MLSRPVEGFCQSQLLHCNQPLQFMHYSDIAKIASQIPDEDYQSVIEKLD